MLKINLSMACAFVLWGLGAVYPQPVPAQSVSIQNGLGEFGYGWMFGRNGTCYIVMPRHVAGPFPRVTVSTEAPVESATATVISPFWPGIDLALGVARGAIGNRCQSELEDLAETRETSSAHQADLLRLNQTGEISREQLQVADRTYLTFTGTLADPEAAIGQGTSGAFAFVGGQPAGMAVSSDDTRRATFIRSGEIFIHVRRYLDEQGGAFAAPSDARVTEPVDDADTDALPLRVLESSVRPVNPMFAPENMTGPGQFVFAQQARMQVAVGFDAITPTSRLVIRSNPGPGQTSPKTVLLTWSLEGEGAGFRSWLRGEMAADGVFDTGKVAQRNLRRLQVIVLDTWGSGDVVIDEITAY